jgi:hypothetical protein
MMDADELEMAEADIDAAEVDEMLDELVDEAEYGEAIMPTMISRFGRRPPVRTATGRPGYGPLGPPDGYVTQKQFTDALTRVGTDVRRNAQGIKSVNSRVNGVVKVNRVQSRAIGKVDKTMKLDGALEFVEAFNPTTQAIDVFQLFKGAVASGFIGQTKGPLGNPFVIGGIGLLLRNPGILSGLFTPPTP